LFSIRSIIIIENTVDNKALRGNPSQTPPARLDCEGLRQCHRSRFLYIHNIELTFSQEVVVPLWIFVVERLDLYEWNCGQEYYKIELIGNEVKGKYVLQRFKNGKDLFESSSIL
jgi:hypothetical protein